MFRTDKQPSASIKAWAPEETAFGRNTRGTRPLVALLLFNGIGAVCGGIALIFGSIGLPLRLLEGTPFSDYTIPGVILSVVVGGSSLAAARVVWQRGRHAALAATGAGAILLGWIVTEFLMIPSAWAPQLLYLAISLAIIRLGWTMVRDPERPV